jgi:hypothetical protein
MPWAMPNLKMLFSNLSKWFSGLNLFEKKRLVNKCVPLLKLLENSSFCRSNFGV